jgi:hypothetical protein
MPEHLRRGNATKSKFRAFVEYVFSNQKRRIRIRVRTFGIASARIKIGVANIAYNMRRVVFHRQKTATPA